MFNLSIIKISEQTNFRRVEEDENMEWVGWWNEIRRQLQGHDDQSLST